jgi:hypothetical protein
MHDLRGVRKHFQIERHEGLYNALQAKNALCECPRETACVTDLEHYVIGFENGDGVKKRTNEGKSADLVYHFGGAMYKHPAARHFQRELTVSPTRYNRSGLLLEQS